MHLKAEKNMRKKYFFEFKTVSHTKIVIEEMKERENSWSRYSKPTLNSYLKFIYHVRKRKNGPLNYWRKQGWSKKKQKIVWKRCYKEFPRVILESKTKIARKINEEKGKRTWNLNLVCRRIIYLFQKDNRTQVDAKDWERSYWQIENWLFSTIIYSRREREFRSNEYFFV